MGVKRVAAAAALGAACVGAQAVPDFCDAEYECEYRTSGACRGDRRQPDAAPAPRSFTNRLQVVARLRTAPRGAAQTGFMTRHGSRARAAAQHRSMIRSDGRSGCPPSTSRHHLPANCLRSHLPVRAPADWTRNFYDLKPLCNGGASYTTPPSATGWTITFQICGQANAVCVPQYEVTYNRGAAVQFLDNNAPAGNCTDASGNSQPCTPNCEVIGVGVPIISQLDPSNPAGGVNLSYYSVPENGKDSFKCPDDPIVSVPLSFGRFAVASS